MVIGADSFLLASDVHNLTNWDDFIKGKSLVALEWCSSVEVGRSNVTIKSD